MPKKRLSMRKIREVLRLKYECNCSNRIISQSCGIGSSTVSDYLQRARMAGLEWPLPDEIDDAVLERKLFPPATPRNSTRFIPDFQEVYNELQSGKGKGVTLNLLWQEYKERHPDGYQYSWFCHSYRDWLACIDVVMRHDHRAGEKLFVDYAGQTVDIVDASTGAVNPAQIFVAVLGASNYTYAEATASQGLEDWIGSHVRAFSFFGGVPEAVIPDNLKSGVSRPDRYEPDINPTYNDLARHYNTIILPARVRKPRDKAKVENGVLLVERWILAKLRNHTFFTLSDLNKEIKRLLQKLNEKPFKKLPGCRKSRFEAIEKPALKPLPSEPYEFAMWKKAVVQIDYHVEVERHYYSVPFTLCRKTIDIRYTANTVECFYRNTRIASHVRNNMPGGHSTIREHMPVSHQRYLEWSPERLTEKAGKIGHNVLKLAEKLLKEKRHFHQACRSLLGVFRLEKAYGTKRLDAACKRALHINALSCRSIESILKNGLDRKSLPGNDDEKKPVRHGNIRGSDYYSTN